MQVVNGDNNNKSMPIIRLITTTSLNESRRVPSKLISPPVLQADPSLPSEEQFERFTAVAEVAQTQQLTTKSVKSGGPVTP
jgi:hypothetical protein